MSAFTPLPRAKGAQLVFAPIHGQGPRPSDGDFHIHPARYAKGKALIQTPSPDGWKTRAARLAEAVGGRWTNREGGYIVSPAQAERFQRLFAEGRDANAFTGKLED